MLGSGWILVGEQQGDVAQVLRPGSGHPMSLGNTSPSESAANSHPARRASRRSVILLLKSEPPLCSSPLPTLMDPEGLGGPQFEVWKERDARQRHQREVKYSSVYRESSPQLKPGLDDG